MAAVIGFFISRVSADIPTVKKTISLTHHYPNLYPCCRKH